MKKRKSVVLDSWAVLAWIRNEPAAAAVDRLLNEADSGRIAILMSWINAGEAYYILARKHSRMAAKEFLVRLPSLPIRLVLPDETAVIEAAELKSGYRLSYADAFAAALAIRENSAVMTGDPELLAVKGLAVEWIGATSPPL